MELLGLHFMLLVLEYALWALLFKIGLEPLYLLIVRFLQELREVLLLAPMWALSRQLLGVLRLQTHGVRDNEIGLRHLVHTRGLLIHVCVLQLQLLGLHMLPL